MSNTDDLETQESAEKAQKVQGWHVNLLKQFCIVQSACERKGDERPHSVRSVALVGLIGRFGACQMSHRVIWLR